MNKFSIGEYVRHKKQYWEIIRIDNQNSKSPHYLLSPRQSNDDDIWVSEIDIAKSSMRQLYLEL